jgi:hypothetical protein
MTENTKHFLYWGGGIAAILFLVFKIKTANAITSTQGDTAIVSSGGTSIPDATTTTGTGIATSIDQMISAQLQAAKITAETTGQAINAGTSVSETSIKAGNQVPILNTILDKIGLGNQLNLAYDAQGELTQASLGTPGSATTGAVDATNAQKIRANTEARLAGRPSPFPEMDTVGSFITNNIAGIGNAPPAAAVAAPKKKVAAKKPAPKPVAKPAPHPMAVKPKMATAPAKKPMAKKK